MSDEWVDAPPKQRYKQNGGWPERLEIMKTGKVLRLVIPEGKNLSSPCASMRVQAVRLGVTAEYRCRSVVDKATRTVHVWLEKKEAQ